MSRYAPWAQRLQEVADAGRWRRVRTITPTGPMTGDVDGVPCIIACSNDYLGLASHPDVQRAASGGGSTGSRLITGSRPIHAALEDALEAWLGRPCLLFGSGWHANVAIGSTLATAGQRVGSDASNHASLIDGLRLGAAERVILPHVDPDAIPPGLDLIVVEGLFSMDGVRPDLTRYPTAPWLAVDEAHSIGCIGPDGRGVAAAQGIVPDVLMGTFGKAFGGSGAFVCGPQELKDLLINTARSFIFTTSPPEPVLAMALASLTVASDELRGRLASNVVRLRQGLGEQGWSCTGADHIVPVVVGDNALRLAERLLQQGVFAPAIRWPTVPKGEERLRLTVSAAHTPDQLDRIVEALGPKP